MKHIVFILSVLASAHSFAAGFIPEESFKEFKCEKELQAQLKTWFASAPQWDRVADPDFETQAFRAPVKTGEWYELHITEKKLPAVTFFSSEKMEEFTWNVSCKMSTKPGPGFEFFKQTKKKSIEGFSDADLSQLLKSKKKGVIYIWSPRMVYSVTEFTRFRAAIQKKGFDFTPVLDHAVDVGEAKDAMKSAGVELKLRTAGVNREPSSADFYRKLNSVDLYMRNANLHFPTMFVYANGKVHPRRLTGVLNNEGLDKALDQWMEELK
jgi:hypothetical protein